VTVAKLCLKARPTAVQLADRLRAVDGRVADGLELYLAAEDLASQEALDGVVRCLEAAGLPTRFPLLIEGPVDALDGADFDVTRESEADYAVLRRLAELARRIGARAVNIHLIAPSSDVARLTLDCRLTLLERSVKFVNFFVDVMDKAGAVPTLENMPPVLRMRRSDFAFTPIGMCSEDLNWMAERAPGVRVLVDTSHAGLYLNARALAHAAGRNTQDAAPGHDVPSVAAAHQPPSDSAGPKTANRTAGGAPQNRARREKASEAASREPQTGPSARTSQSDAAASHSGAQSCERADDNAAPGGRPQRDATSRLPKSSAPDHNTPQDAPWREPLLRFLRQLPSDGPTVLDYVQRFGAQLENAQVSNAAGLLGEGLPYAEGELDLDPIIAWLGQHTRHIVAETVERNHDDAVFMRDALRRMRAVLG
jgi:hypothetical protein